MEMVDGESGAKINYCTLGQSVMLRIRLVKSLSKYRYSSDLLTNCLVELNFDWIK